MTFAGTKQEQKLCYHDASHGAAAQRKTKPIKAGARLVKNNDQRRPVDQDRELSQC